MHRLIYLISKFIPSSFSYIRFLTGSRAKSGYWYKNGSFKPMGDNPPGTPLRLEDFETVKYVAPGRIAQYALIKCTFKNGEEAMATVPYEMLESLAEFIVV